MPPFILLINPQEKQQLQEALTREPGAPWRVGFIASRKIGNAVARNRAKRRLRALVRRVNVPQLPPGDYVLIARHGALTCDFSHMEAYLEKTLAKVSFNFEEKGKATSFQKK